jgi:IS5 family transposase
MMFKILILQAWYALSDEALEKQIARDLGYAKVSSI